MQTSIAVQSTPFRPVSDPPAEVGMLSTVQLVPFEISARFTYAPALVVE